MKPEEITYLIQTMATEIATRVADEMIKTHIHSGTDSQQIDGFNVKNAPQSALTTATTGISSGGTEAMTTSDANILNNMRTRINELETKLRNLGLLR